MFIFEAIFKTSQTSIFICHFPIKKKLQQKYIPAEINFLYFSLLWSPNVSKLEQFVRTLNARYARSGSLTIKTAPSCEFKTPQEIGAELALVVVRLLRFWNRSFLFFIYPFGCFSRVIIRFGYLASWYEEWNQS